MHFNTAIATLSVSLSFSLASPATTYYPSGGCPPISGDFNVSYFQLYPEGFDYDPVHCKAYFGSLFNSTVLRKDLSTGEEEVLTFPDISENHTYHVSGVQYDRKTGAMYFSANNGIAFSSNGADLTGPNRFIKYNTSTDRVVFITDMDSVVAQLNALTGYQYNGFQDMAEDLAGNAYYVTSLGPSIFKVTPDGTPSIFFYLPPKFINGTVQSNWGGIFSVGNILVSLDNFNGKMFRLDTTAKDPFKDYTTYSLADSPVQVHCDRTYPPPMFDGKIVLCSNDGNGTYVLYSNDLWQSAKYLGLAASPNYGGIPTASCQIANSLYTNTEYFLDGVTFDKVGNRTDFPFTDITQKVLQLTRSVGIDINVD
ncbi:hypothetical protein Egran_06212 [Elaphomyces granulatus]|uniref:SMP-30/Gluconolactonase/LRE-like region domain-containing protein n=1 Tax=Elaphomyces granulatus TaxID=519963 RepID=A0A232LPC6_9EURO|nr:hypothetical protein Egran_06212 [Elaphomyces granulatus]